MGTRDGGDEPQVQPSPPPRVPALVRGKVAVAVLAVACGSDDSPEPRDGDASTGAGGMQAPMVSGSGGVIAPMVPMGGAGGLMAPIDVCSPRR